ncbi:MAG: hypothetical protein ACLPVW_00120 [Terriglobales bacterium]
MSDEQTTKIAGNGPQPANDPVQPVEVIKDTARYEQSKTEDRKKRRCRKLAKAPIWIQALAAIILVGITGFYTHYARIQSEQAIVAAGAAKNAAETAQKQLEMSERPWVDAIVTPDGPFDFNVNGANIHLKFQLLNTGHSPALETLIEGFPVDSNFTGMPGPIQRRNEICKVNPDPMGIALFPNIPFVQTWTWTFPTAELAKNHGNGTKSPGVIVWPSVVICLIYRSPLSKTAVYHTAYIIDIRRIDPSGRTRTNFKIGENIDQKQLRLVMDSESPISAD